MIVLPNKKLDFTNQKETKTSVSIVSSIIDKIGGS